MDGRPLHSCYDGKPQVGPVTFEPSMGLSQATMRFLGVKRRRKAKRLALLKRYGSACHWCGHVCNTNGLGGRKNPGGYTVDHLIPRSKGGTNLISNLVVSCYACNQDKGGMMPDEYRDLLDVRGFKANKRGS